MCLTFPCGSKPSLSLPVLANSHHRGAARQMPLHRPRADAGPACAHRSLDVRPKGLLRARGGRPDCNGPACELLLAAVPAADLRRVPRALRRRRVTLQATSLATTLQATSLATTLQATSLATTLQATSFALSGGRSLRKQRLGRARTRAASKSADASPPTSLV
jgi:hypothetical protein